VIKLSWKLPTKMIHFTKSMKLVFGYSIISLLILKKKGRYVFASFSAISRFPEQPVAVIKNVHFENINAIAGQGILVYGHADSQWKISVSEMYSSLS
jgi:hypothetical protein